MSAPLCKANNPAMRLLLVEDDEAMQSALHRALTRRGFVVTAVGDAAHALREWQLRAPGLVLLDLSLPDMDGLDVLAQARALGLRTPVLVLTARGTVGDRVLGLNAGADDYLPKPFDLDELEARLRALVRRHTPSTAQPVPEWATSPYQMGELRYEIDSGAVYWRDAPLELTPREALMMQALMARPGHAVTKERLFETVFAGEPGVQIEAVEVVAYRLRKKLADTGVRLVTLRGLGYLLKASA